VPRFVLLLVSVTDINVKQRITKMKTKMKTDYNGAMIKKIMKNNRKTKIATKLNQNENKLKSKKKITLAELDSCLRIFNSHFS